ncbi:MAG: heat-inducible transcriptional repressor HrcA [bacterium]|jgi:heat-inducible transcriptional repressor
MELDQRKRRILQAVIDSYVDSAEPVGSRTLARRFQLGVSPATIRNEMADLAELGYLEQPHTSAGRIPSNKGYRYYVDFLLQIRRLADQDLARIRESYRNRSVEIDRLIQQTAKILSHLTNYTSLVLDPRQQRQEYRYLQLLPLSCYKAVIILVTNAGNVEHALIDLPQGITEDEIEKIALILNEKMRDLTLDEVKTAMLRDLETEFWRHLTRFRIIETLFSQLSDVMQRFYRQEAEDRIYLGGATNILTQPEFRDVEKAKALLGLLEEEEVLHRLLTETDADRITVSIGRENKLSEMQDCSMVTAHYIRGDRSVGTIGILGPTRMDYGRVIAILELVTQNLNSVLEKDS